MTGTVTVLIERGVTVDVELATAVVRVEMTGTPGLPGGGALPLGGAVGTFLRKRSTSDSDAEWADVDDGYF